jgi:hypothetical protein
MVVQVYMKQIDSRDKVQGDLLRVGHVDGMMVLIFKDGRYAVYRPCNADEGECPLEFTYRFPRAAQLMRVGLLTDAQYYEQMALEGGASQ